MKCDQCDSCYINNVFCHEIGCPNSWKDENGKGYSIDCYECGFKFTPTEKPFPHGMICEGCHADKEAEFNDW